MKTLAVFLLFLAISSVFTSRVSLKALDKIREDELGAPFVDLIDLNLRLKTPISDIAKLLDGILQALLADRELLLQNYQTQSTLLNNAITIGTSLINSYQNTVSVLGESIANDQSTMATTQTNLLNNQKSLTDEQNSLTGAQTDYQKYVPNAESDRTDLSNAIASIKKAIERMQTYQSSGVEQKIFLQVSSSLKREMKKITDALEGMKKTLTETNSMYTPIVQELIELSTDMTQEKADKIISLLKQLLELLQNTLNNVQTQLATYKSNYDLKFATLTENINKYNLDISQDNEDLLNLQQRIKQSQDDLTTTNQLLSEAQDKLAADQKSLQDLTNNYNIQDDRYKRLIPLIRNIIKSFETNIVAGNEDAVNTVDTD